MPPSRTGYEGGFITHIIQRPPRGPRAAHGPYFGLGERGTEGGSTVRGLVRDGNGAPLLGAAGGTGAEMPPHFLERNTFSRNNFVLPRLLALLPLLALLQWRG